MKKNYLYVIGLVLFLVSVFSCQMPEESSGETDGSGENGPAVYIGGSYTDLTTNDINPCYWKNSERIDLSIPENATEGLVWDLIVVNNLVYCVGSYNNESNEEVPCFWEGTERHDLPVTGGTGVGAYGIDIVDDVVYITGYYYPDSGSFSEKPCYWIDSVFHDLDFEGAGLEIKVEDDNIYLAGSNNCYWVGDTQVDIPEGATENIIIKDLDVQDGTVYTVGRLYSGSDTEQACFWIGTTRTVLSLPGNNSFYANAIDVFDETVYTAGLYYENSASQPCYWEGTERTDLSKENWYHGSLRDIMILNGTVYSAGELCSEGWDSCAVAYWVGTELTEIPIDEGYGIQVNAMYVTE